MPLLDADKAFYPNSKCRIEAAGVEAYPDFTLLITFDNGEKRLFDMKPELEHRVFQRLKNPALFKKAKNQACGIVWDDDTDIAIEWTYWNGKPV